MNECTANKDSEFLVPRSKEFHQYKGLGLDNLIEVASSEIKYVGPSATEDGGQQRESGQQMRETHVSLARILGEGGVLPQIKAKGDFYKALMRRRGDVSLLVSRENGWQLVAGAGPSKIFPRTSSSNATFSSLGPVSATAHFLPHARCTEFMLRFLGHIKQTVNP